MYVLVSTYMHVQRVCLDLEGARGVCWSVWSKSYSDIITICFTGEKTEAERFYIIIENSRTVNKSRAQACTLFPYPRETHLGGHLQLWRAWPLT